MGCKYAGGSMPEGGQQCGKGASLPVTIAEGGKVAI